MSTLTYSHLPPSMGHFYNCNKLIHQLYKCVHVSMATFIFVVNSYVCLCCTKAFYYPYPHLPISKTFSVASLCSLIFDLLLFLLNPLPIQLNTTCDLQHHPTPILPHTPSRTSFQPHITVYCHSWPEWSQLMTPPSYSEYFHCLPGCPQTTDYLISWSSHPDPAYLGLAHNWLLGICVFLYMYSLGDIIFVLDSFNRQKGYVYFFVCFSWETMLLYLCMSGIIKYNYNWVIDNTI